MLKKVRLLSSSTVWLLVIAAGVILWQATLRSLGHFQVQAAENCEAISCSKDQGETEYLTCNKRKQTCWEEKIAETRNATVSLSNTINLLNGQIQIQQLQIDQTLAEISQLEKQIVDLTQRIGGLNLSLDRLTTILVKRVQEQYKHRGLSPLATLLQTSSVSQGVMQHKYVTLAQEQTATAMQVAEQQKQTYDEQKALKETKQAEVERKKAQLEQQRTTLSKQRSEQQFLLQQTKNDEARYQRELEKTLAELEAIQSIIAGRGVESKVGDINEGDKIASIIVGSSPCSSGTHLHFEVVKDGAHRDPAGFLKPVDVVWNNKPDSSFGFGGDWEWPLNNPARINQGYGMTYYARPGGYYPRGAYGGAPHTGIDLVSKNSGDYTVKAVKKGTAYRGSIACGGGQLRYVRVEHQDGGYSTYYLHVNY